MLAVRPFFSCLLTLGSVTSATVAAQHTTITGVVLAARDGSPLAGASIRQVGTANAVAADPTGRFLIALLGARAATLEILAPGYDAASVVIEPGPQDTIDIPAGAIRLIESSNGVAERRAAGRGVFIDRAQLLDWHPTTLTDLLRHVPGVRIRLLPGRGLGGDPRRYTATMTRGPETCSPVAFIDGAYAGPIAEYDLDDLIAPGDLEVVEVYRSPSEVPPRFDVLGAGCGVLAFWTRSD